MKPTIVIALGGNALLKRGQLMSYDNQLANISIVARSISKLVDKYRIAIVHGNGPQVGLLAQQNDVYTSVPAYPLSCLVAETQGMISTILIQELRKLVVQPVTSIITHVEVDVNDAAFLEPNKFIGGVYDKQEAESLAQQYHWQIKQDGQYYRRVVASPKPLSIQENQIIRSALDQDNIVICCGGGGIPVSQQEGQLSNTDCVIDKDASASLLAKEIQAEYFLILTDGDGIYLNWGKENQQKLDQVAVQELLTYQFDKGSMQPKVDAIIDYVSNVNNGIGIIADMNFVLEALEGEAGTRVIK
ncbi:carbamate kinase [Gallibacterium salpingitidis]|uniref:Carbamate kinase n=1 Tax=Gallibacterium salpingitidis TaxID=505341 RepID=A0A1A7P2R3_9PAST|nr:carbamate kinase [Gallibacterium salpingitidis]OBW96120.1 carbamate kinase [Gallibacterium salpingitidis]